MVFKDLHIYVQEIWVSQFDRFSAKKVTSVICATPFVRCPTIDSHDHDVETLILQMHIFHSTQAKNNMLLLRAGHKFCKWTEFCLTLGNHYSSMQYFVPMFRFH